MVWMVIICLFLIGLLYTIGSGTNSPRKYGNIAFGFIIYSGFLELFGFSFVAFHLHKIGFICISGIIAVLLLIYKLKQKKLSHNIFFDMKSCWIGALVTAIIIAITFVLYRSDADDSFYVSNAALFQNSNLLNMYDSSFGNKSLGTVPMYDFQVWESLIAVVSSLFRVDAVSMMHTYLLPVLLIASASGYLYLGEVLFEDKWKANLFYLFLSVFHLFGGYAVYSEGSFLLSRLWQGKAVYLTVILPVMSGIILSQYKTKDENLWFKLSLCILAGMALNPTSLFILGFQMLFLVVIAACKERKFKWILHIIPSACIIVFFTVMIYLRTSAFAGQIEASSNTSATFVLDTFMKFWGEGRLYLVLYGAAVVLILLWGNVSAKLYMVFSPLAMALSIWNPYLGRLVAENVTKVPSYWRVFWLLPVGISLSYVIVLIHQKIQQKKFISYIVLLLGFLAVSFPGKWMFSQANGFLVAKNAEKLPEEVISFGESIIEEKEYPIVLGCDDFSTTLRQKFTQIELISSRYQYILDLFYYRNEETEANERIQMMLFANGSLDNFEGIETVLNKYQVDYIILKSDAIKEIEFLTEMGWVTCKNSSNYVMLEL